MSETRTVILKDVVDFRLGINQTRAGSTMQASDFYTTCDLEADLRQETSGLPASTGGVVREGDVILNLVARRAAVAGGANAGKRLRSPFVRCMIDHDVVDPWWLCHLVNCSSDLWNALLEGGSRLPSLGQFSEVAIRLPDISMQRRIGRLYKDLCRLIALDEARTKALEKAVLGVIEKIGDKENKDV